MSSPLQSNYFPVQVLHAPIIFRLSRNHPSEIISGYLITVKRGRIPFSLSN